jgi:hypothetical protein
MYDHTIEQIQQANTKRCSKCGEVKDITAFSPNLYTRSKVQSYCRQCGISHNAHRPCYERITVGEKACNKCGAIMPVSEFYADKHHRDGLSNQCKTCRKQYGIQWNAANRDKIAKRIRKHREPRTTGTKACIDCGHIKSVHEFSINRHNTRDGLQTRCRVCWRQWRKSNAETLRGYERKYLHTPKGKRVIAVKNSNRRSHKNNRHCTLTSSEWESLVSYWGGCAYSSADCRGALTLDHVIPISRTSGDTTIFNCVPCCDFHNKSKGNRTPEESGLQFCKPRLTQLSLL